MPESLSDPRIGAKSPGGSSSSGRSSWATSSSPSRASGRSGRPGPRPRSSWSASPGPGVRRAVRDVPRRLPRVPRLPRLARDPAGPGANTPSSRRDPGREVRPGDPAPRVGLVRQRGGRRLRARRSAGFPTAGRPRPTPSCSSPGPSTGWKSTASSPGRVARRPAQGGPPGVPGPDRRPRCDFGRSRGLPMPSPVPTSASTRAPASPSGAGPPSGSPPWPMPWPSAACRIVLTGSAAEAELTRAVAAAMRHPALDLAGRTELGPLAALIDGARLLVSNDTGVAHLAVARKVPSVIVSTGDNPARWAPIDASRHRVLCDDAQGWPPPRSWPRPMPSCAADRPTPSRRPPSPPTWATPSVTSKVDIPPEFPSRHATDPDLDLAHPRQLPPLLVAGQRRVHPPRRPGGREGYGGRGTTFPVRLQRPRGPGRSDPHPRPRRRPLPDPDQLRGRRPRAPDRRPARRFPRFTSNTTRPRGTRPTPGTGSTTPPASSSTSPRSTP